MSRKTKTTATKEEAKPALVPKLRFPEFREMQGWDIEEVGDLLEESRTPSLLNDPSRRITVRLHLQGVEHREHRGTESTESTNNFCRKAGQFIYGKQNIHKGAFGIIPDQLNGFETSQDLPSFDFKHRCCPQWFYFNFASEAVYGPIELKMTGTGSKRLNEKTFLSLPIAVPSYSEQQKIAECLSSVDELMAAQARKVDALKTHKKGLMQQLFPHEGETQPRLRFPEFRKAGVWTGQPLKDVFSIFQGFAFSSNDSVEQGSRWLKIADVGIQLMNHDSPSFLPDDYKERFTKFSVREGDYVMALTRPILNGQLKIAQVDSIFDGALLNQRVGKLITSQHPAFVYFLLQSWKLIDDIEKSISGNDPPNLSAQQIEGIKTYIPRLPEQQRIATCLSSLDALITAETQKHEALKTHKKGLMQQLFPSPEEVVI